MYKLFRPILFQFDPESSHNIIVKMGGFFSAPLFRPAMHRLFDFEHPSLESEVFGHRFKNPIGLAPGYDKAGGFSRFMSVLGFGFIEIGTVTPLPQPGNPRPRLFRLEKDEAIINRMGFNSIGMKAVAENLKKLNPRDFVAGINLGKNKITANDEALRDYLAGFIELAPLADYVVINVSSPNTPGLRELQDKGPLIEILKILQEKNHFTPSLNPSPPSLRQRLRRAMQGGGKKEGDSSPLVGEARWGGKPLLLKISPDLTDGQLDDIVAVALETKISGLIATNTTISRVGLETDPETLAKIGAGGVSGRPLKERNTEVIAYLYEKTQGQIPIIGAGGIFSAEDAYEKIRAGASLVEIYTGMIYEGPGLIKKIKKGLVELLRKDGFKNISEAVGADHR